MLFSLSVFSESLLSMLVEVDGKIEEDEEMEGGEEDRGESMGGYNCVCASVVL